VNDSDDRLEQRRRIREIVRFSDGQFVTANDSLATEEPFEIRVVFGKVGKRKDRSLSITMRTPGHDQELAAGFLLGEGIVNISDDIELFEVTGAKADGSQETNQLCVHLSQGVAFDFGSLQRNFYTTSSCGICGKASLEAVRSQLKEPVRSIEMLISPAVICSLPDSLRKHQSTFEATGGLHAAGLFDASGNIVDSYEDVGRHNALDKLIGSQFLSKATPLSNRIVVVSGRASFELVQKVISAGVPVLVAVGAPSSLAAELADEFGVTLVGFASGKRFNVYSHSQRIGLDT
jgi:FdhD protein